MWYWQSLPNWPPKCSIWLTKLGYIRPFVWFLIFILGGVPRKKHRVIICCIFTIASYTTIDQSIEPFFHVSDLATMAKSSQLSCSAPTPKVRKTDSAEQRRFLLWKTEFPWVFMDNECSCMCCSYCIDAKNNSFMTGCNKFKKDLLRKHATTVNHHAECIFILRNYPVLILICPHMAFMNMKPSAHTMDNQKPQNLVLSSSQ